MSKIPSIFEQELRNQAPARLDAAFLDRLTACAEGTQTEMPEEDARFAAGLAAVSPRAIPSAMQASLLEAIGETPFALDGKIVLFNKRSKQRAAKVRTFRSFNLAAAAAVALLGSLAALMIPAGKDRETASIPGPVSSPRLSNNNPHVVTAANSGFVPASFGRNLSETRDEGVIWRGNNQPHRVLRLTYLDKVTMKNANGESIQMEKPRYEYVLIPERVD